MFDQDVENKENIVKEYDGLTIHYNIVE